MISRLRAHFPLITLVSGFTALAVPSVVLWFLSLEKGCAWQVGWLSCSPPVHLMKAFFIGGILTVVGALWAYITLTLFRSPELFCNKTTRFSIPLLMVFVCLVVPLGSSDMTYYRGAAQAILSGQNPFVTTWPRSYIFARDFLPDTTVTGFSYGPLAADLFAGVEHISQGNPFLFLLIWKIFMMGSLFAVAVLVSFLVQKEGERALAKTTLLFFPVLLFEWVTNGHFDGLWVVTVLLGMCLARERQWMLAAAVLTIGVWLKFLPLLTFPWFFLWWWQDTKGNSRERIYHVLGGSFLVGGITLAAWAPFWAGPHVFTSIIMQSKWAIMSLFSTVYYGVQPLAMSVLGEGYHWYLTRGVHAALFALLLWLVWPLVRQGWKALFYQTVWGEKETMVAITISFTVFLMVWQKSFWPWYVAWLLPFVWYLRERNFLQKVGKNIWVYICAAPVFFYPLWFVTNTALQKDPTPLWWFGAVVTLGVWGYPLISFIRYRLSHTTYE